MLRTRKSALSSPLRTIISGIALIVIAIGICIGGYYGWLVYQRYENARNLPTEQQMKSDQAVRQSAEGRDESKVTNSAIDEYKTAASNPRVLTIPSISVRARMLPMDVNPDNSLQAPININDSGWYTGGALPGEKGAVVVDGHASGPTRQGLFAYLDTLQSGDEISIERGDGKVFTYSVVHVESVPLADINMKKVITPYTGVDEGLNLITCAGEWLQDRNTYDHRAVVYTKRVE